MKHLIKVFLNKIDVDDNSINEIIFNYEYLEKNELDTQFLSIVNQYENEFFDYQNLMLNIHNFEKNNKLNTYQYDLLCIICLFITLKDLYIKHNLPTDIYWNSAKDIKYKIIECQLVKNVTGTFVSEWYKNFFTLKRFGIGRLQYELTKTNFEYQDEKTSISSNDEAIAIHIPRNGENLSIDKVNESIEQAVKFFNKGKPLIFICESWLLFPKTIEMVSATSNIYHFYKLFKIIKTYDLDDYSEMWRLFDCEISNIDSLPEDSSLRKNYKKHMQNKGKVGESVGFLIK